MMDAIPSKLLTEWQAYDRLEPFGPRRDDLRAGKIAATFAEIHRDRDRHPEPFTADEFAIHFETAEEEPEPDEPDPMTHANMLLHKLMGALGGGPPGMVGSA